MLSSIVSPGLITVMAKTMLSSIVSPGLITVMLSLLVLFRFSLLKIQRLINCSAHLIFKVPKSAHITPFLYDLHWLPIGSQIQYKIALICFHIVSGTVPPYPSALLHLYSPSCSFRSAADAHIFRVPRMGRRTLGERSFQYLVPVLWNSLPVSVRHSSSLF